MCPILQASLCPISFRAGRYNISTKPSGSTGKIATSLTVAKTLAQSSSRMFVGVLFILFSAFCGSCQLLRVEHVPKIEISGLGENMNIAWRVALIIAPCMQRRSPSYPHELNYQRVMCLFVIFGRRLVVQQRFPILT